MQMESGLRLLVFLAPLLHVGLPRRLASSVHQLPSSELTHAALMEPWTVIGFWALTFTPVDAQASPCLLRCKDGHMFQMRDVLGDVSEWSLEFLMPIQTILKSSSSPTAAIRLLGTACRLNRNYDYCLESCPTTMAKNFLSLGLAPWRYICDSLATGELKFVVPCWQENVSGVQSACHSLLLTLQLVLTDLAHSTSSAYQEQNFSHLCRGYFSAIKAYDSCHLSQLHSVCGGTAAAFLDRLNRVTNDTLFLLLQYASVRERLPPDCEQWAIVDNFTASTERYKWTRSVWTSAAHSSWCSSLPALLILSLPVFLLYNLYICNNCLL